VLAWSFISNDFSLEECRTNSNSRLPPSIVWRDVGLLRIILTVDADAGRLFAVTMFPQSAADALLRSCALWWLINRLRCYCFYLPQINTGRFGLPAPGRPQPFIAGPGRVFSTALSAISGVSRWPFRLHRR
jgi:hypothetical protein